MSSSNSYRWGILGTGYAATEFATGLRSISASIAAVGSESIDRANTFAARHSIAKTFGTYDELIHSDAVDIVYVGAVAPLHRDLCLRAIDAGKPVLCEKPFAMNAAEATEVAAAATQKGVFCMEAMWSRFIPLMVEISSLIKRGEIGDVVHVASDFGLRQTPQSNARLFKSREGGVVRDLAVYPIALATQYLGEPDRVDIRVTRSPEGVDRHAAGTLGYASGSTANILADISAATPTRGTIIGTEGFIEIQSPVYRPTQATLVRTFAPKASSTASSSGGGSSSKIRKLAKIQKLAGAVKRKLIADGRTLHLGYQANGYQYQALEVMRCLDGGRTQSDVMPLSESVAIMKIVDAALDQR